MTYGGQPLQGSTSNLYAVTDRNGEWTRSDTWPWDPFQIMVTTVPTPPTVVALCTLAALRRRR